MKRNVFAAMFMCLMMGCGVESRGAQVDSTEHTSTSSESLTPASEQSCLAGCLQDCGAVCQFGSGKAACIAECRAENQECREFCAGQ